MSRRSGLGRGLGALIPQGSGGDASLRDIPLSQISPNRLQPRTVFDEDSLSSLVDSIRAVGILQPILVRQRGEQDYELIAGERRFRAAHRAGLATVPALVSEVDDAMSLAQALVENLQRDALNALDEAGAYQQLLEDFGLTHEEVGRRVGKSRAAVTNALRLFQLPPSVQQLVRDERLSPGAARAVLATPDRELQQQIAARAAREGLSVRAVEELVREHAETVVPGDDTLGAETSLPDLASEGGASAGSLPALRPPGVLDLEELLGNHLNTRVRIDMGGRRGRITIEFATLDDLERIYKIVISGGESDLGPSLAADEG